jgi:hypothetical protein
LSALSRGASRWNSAVYRQSIRLAHKQRTARMLHTFGTIEYRGEGLDIFILRNGNNVRPLRSFCVQDILHPVISGRCRHDGKSTRRLCANVELRHRRDDNNRLIHTRHAYKWGKQHLVRYWTDNSRQTEETRGIIHYDRRPKAEMQQNVKRQRQLLERRCSQYNP